jgi:glyoxylase-like metal-dependent hydrolase (beta-lactamase superfamily II)/rhodanese-related sulfurtransferase
MTTSRLRSDLGEPVAARAPIRVTALEIPGLGNHCHIASDGQVAVVVDPPRDVDRCLALSGRLGARVTWVVETHVHNDYVSGGLELARLTGASYGLAAAEKVSFAQERRGLSDGDVIETGAMRIRCVHTPGHTEHHLAYVLSDAATGEPLALFSGGSWLPGTAGRTDLLGAALTERLARAQWASIRRLAAELPDSVELRPTHGFGSFCAGGATAADQPGTVGDERATQPALHLDETAFVRQLVAGFIAHPRYYAHMAPLNRAGAAPIDLRPAPDARPRELARRVAAGEWVVDLRPRDAFAAAHAEGWINIEAGDSFATYLGWLLPWGTPVTLAAEDQDVVAGAQRALARIGIDRPAAQVVRPFREWVGGADPRSYPLATFADLAAAQAGGVGREVIDIRRDDEWRAGHLRGAHHLPLPDLSDRLGEVRDWGENGPVWVHCEAGFRAAIAASLLDAHGIPVVLVSDSLDAAVKAGLDLQSGTRPG